MNDSLIINSFIKGVTIISDNTYECFLKSYNLNKNDFGEITKLESTIATFSLFNYFLKGRERTPALDDEFYNRCYSNIEKNHPIMQDLSSWLIPIRNNFYIKYLENSYEDDWQIGFIRLLEHNLKVTKHGSIPMENYPDSSDNNEDDSLDILARTKFIESQKISIYCSVRLMDEVLSGKPLSDVNEKLNKLRDCAIDKPQSMIVKWRELQISFGLKPSPMQSFIDSVIAQSHIISKKLFDRVYREVLMNRLSMVNHQREPLLFECKLFSLWLISKCFNSEEMNQIILKRVNILLRLSIEEERHFIRESEQRYKTYDLAFIKWLKRNELSEENDYSYTLIGSFLTEIIKNLNPYFPFENDVPQNDYNDDLSMLTFFENNFNETLNRVRQMKIRYKV